MTITTSSRLPSFVAQWESPGGRPVLRAYRCPAGVVTIGHGATDRSAAFRRYWMTLKGHRLRMGDTITVEQANEALDIMLREEYAPPVNKAMPDTVSQHAFDGSTSVSYNCGPGSLTWRWAKALAAGDVKLAADLLTVTATKANGRVLKGLVRRRSAEANLILNGYDSLIRAPRGTSNDEIRQFQEWLKTLGYYSGEIDGVVGDMTRGAVKNFQRDHDLETDGIVGPATTAAMVRALDSRRSTQMSAGTGTGGAGAAAVTSAEQTPVPDSSADLISLSVDAVQVLTYGLAAAAIVFAAYWIYRNRGRIFRTRRVPT